MREDSNSIGGPIPLEADGPGLSSWHLGLGMILVVCGGFTIFSATIIPHRTRGATCSARLQWQQQVQEPAAVAPEAASAPAKSANEDVVLPLPP